MYTYIHDVYRYVYEYIVDLIVLIQFILTWLAFIYLQLCTRHCMVTYFSTMFILIRSSKNTNTDSFLLNQWRRWISATRTICKSSNVLWTLVLSSPCLTTQVCARVCLLVHVRICLWSAFKRPRTKGMFVLHMHKFIDLCMHKYVYTYVFHTYIHTQVMQRM